MISKPFSASVSPVSVSFELGHGADIAGVQFGDGLQRFAVRAAQVRQAFRRILVHVLQVAVVLDDAGIDPEVVDASGERVGGGLENVGGGQVAFGDGPMGLGAVDESGDLAALRGSRHIVDDQVQDQIAADVVVGGDAHITGKMRISRIPVRMPSRMCSTGSVPFSKNSSM